MTMISFTQYMTEEKNLHMTHIEDSVIDGGVRGTRRAINYMQDIRDTLAGHAKTPVELSVKWDGAPAVFAGIDPSDGKFFVAKKGIFNKNPKIYKTPGDVDADISGELNVKLKLALKEFAKLGIKNVIQGDFLYAKNDLQKATIDGESYITFHPNTIAYAVPEKSHLAKTIRQSKVGVVWHTVYRGSTLETMSASFAEEITRDHNEVSSVWSVDAVFKDVSGHATFTQEETDRVTKLLSQAGTIFQKLPAKVIDGLSSNELRRIRVNAFINSKIRVGERINDPSKFVDALIRHSEEYFQKDIDSKKSDRGRVAAQTRYDDAISYFQETKKSNLVALFTLYNHLVDAKLMIVNKLNEVQGMKTFLKTKNGYEVTGQEGFVAIDRLGKNALKLVDRLEFSKANFSPEFIKGWEH